MIDLHIEELILDGFPPEQRGAIAAALQDELARQLAESAALPSLAEGGRFAQLDGGSFTLTPGAQAEAIGAQIAAQVLHTVHGGMRE